MFTGIISDIGKISTLELNDEIMTVAISTNYDTNNVDIGASIACDGVCLTVVKKGYGKRGNELIFDIGKETLEVTNLASWTVDQNINLERALRLGDELNGHLVLGHVDGLVDIISTKIIGENLEIVLSAPMDLAKYIAKKGSVCLNGTSLTVNEVNGCNFSVNLIPHTQKVTTWSDVKTGDKINLEIDTMARYMARLQEFDK